MRVTWARILAAAILIAGTAAAALTAGAAPAHAITTYDQLCDEGNSNGIYECLNAWNGGPNVRDYTPAVLNDAMGLQGVDRCQVGSNQGTNGCPITNIPAGYFIYQIRDERTGKCVGNQAHNDPGAYEVACNNTSYPGTGGGEGTLFVASFPSACLSGYFILANDYWTNAAGGFSHLRGLHYNGITNGEGVFLNANPAICLNETQFQA